jgi:hypothetical protein
LEKNEPINHVKKSLLTAVELRRLKLCRSRRSPMWKTVNALQSGCVTDLADAEYYLDVLASPYLQPIRDRLIAVDALRLVELTPKQTRRAESLLNMIVANPLTPETVRLLLRTLNIVLRWSIVVLGTVGLGSVLLSAGRDTVVEPVVQLIGAAGIIAGAYGIVATPGHSFMYDYRRELRLRQLAVASLEGGSTDCINTLTTVEPDLWDSAKPALRSILLRLTQDNYGKVTASALERLSNFFRARFKPDEFDEWVRLLLDAFSKVGTGACVASVENVAKNGRKPEWREHASRVLPILVERQQAERHSSRLLRPAVSDKATDSLLRPASTSGAGPEDCLLRAVADANVER